MDINNSDNKENEIVYLTVEDFLNVLLNNESNENKEPIFIESLPRVYQRSFILHVLYSYEINEKTETVSNIIQDYKDNYNYVVLESDKIFSEINNIIKKFCELDMVIISLLDHKWHIERLNIIIVLILRYALYELLYTDNDSAIIINEAIELSKAFAEKDSNKIINGVLDKWIKKSNRDKKILNKRNL